MFGNSTNLFYELFQQVRVGGFFAREQQGARFEKLKEPLATLGLTLSLTLLLKMGSYTMSQSSEVSGKNYLLFLGLGRRLS